MKRTMFELNASKDNARIASAAAADTLETCPYDILYSSGSGPASPSPGVS